MNRKSGASAIVFASKLGGRGKVTEANSKRTVLHRSTSRKLSSSRPRIFSSSSTGRFRATRRWPLGGFLADERDITVKDPGLLWETRDARLRLIGSMARLAPSEYIRGIGYIGYNHTLHVTDTRGICI